MVIPWKISLFTYLIYSFIYLFMSYPWWFHTWACPAYHLVYSRATSHQLTANSQQGTRLFHMNFHVPSHKCYRCQGSHPSAPQNLPHSRADGPWKRVAVAGSLFPLFWPFPFSG